MVKSLWEKYLAPTAKWAKKVIIGLKTFIVTISISEHFSGNKNAAFYFLCTGAVLDFLISMFKETE